METRKYLGVILTIDEEGCLKIPLDKLKTSGIEPNSKVEVFSNGQEVTIKTIETHCNLCNRNAKVIEIGGMKLCTPCKDKLNSGFETYAKEQYELKKAKEKQ